MQPPLASAAGTVEFNVGGETFKVLEQTIRAKPDTLLCTMLDDPACSGKPEKSTEPVFVEANAKLFPFILDWYRYGTILIPSSMSLQQMRRECAFFQLPDAVSIKRDREPLMGHLLSNAVSKVTKFQVEVDKKRAGVKQAMLELVSVLKYEALMNQTLKTGLSTQLRWEVSEKELDLQWKPKLDNMLTGMDNEFDSEDGENEFMQKLQEYAAADGWSLQSRDSTVILQPLVEKQEG